MIFQGTVSQQIKHCSTLAVMLARITAVDIDVR